MLTATAEAVIHSTPHSNGTSCGVGVYIITNSPLCETWALKRVMDIYCKGGNYIPNFTVLHCSFKTVHLHCAPKSPKPHNQSTFILLETFRPDRPFSIQLFRRLWSIVLGVEHEKMQTFSIAFLGRSTSTGWIASRHRFAQPRNQSPSS